MRREQQTDKCIVGGTHQLDGAIVFPAEVSTPAAQVLRGRAATQTHGQTHGPLVLHHTTHSLINCHTAHAQVAVAAFAFLKPSLFFFYPTYLTLSSFFMPNLFPLYVLCISLHFPFFFLSFPSSCLMSLSVWRGCQWHGDWRGAAANPVLIETRVLIKLSHSDR